MARVLVIDDEPMIRETVRTFLEASGHTVIEAENGAVGLAHFSQQPFDLVVTDILMPETEGVETIQNIRRLRPDMKIIAMSGSLSQELYLSAAAKFGANAVLSKPFRAADLRETVARVLSAEQGERSPRKAEAGGKRD